MNTRPIESTLSAPVLVAFAALALVFLITLLSAGVQVERGPVMIHGPSLLLELVRWAGIALSGVLVYLAGLELAYRYKYRPSRAMRG